MKLNITIPRTLNDIKLLWYQRYLQNEAKYETILFKRRAFIEQCCGFDSLGLLEFSDIDSFNLFERLEKVFIGQYDTKLVKQFIVAKTTFKFVDMTKLTMSEYKILEDSLLNLNEIHKALAVLYRDSSGKYNVEYAEFMKHLPLDIVYGVLNHFTELFNNIMKNITGEYLPITTEHILLSGKENKDFVRVILKNNR